MKIKYLATLALAVGFSATSVAETAYNVPINNTATLNYQVNSAPQTAIEAKNTFKVDRKVVFNLTQTPSAVTTGIIGSEFVIEYTLTNTSNAPIRFAPVATDLVAGETAYLADSLVTDNTVAADSEVTTHKVWAEKTTTGFNAANDTDVTDGLGYVELDQDASITLYVVTTPAVGDNNDIFVHELTITAQEHTDTPTNIPSAVVGAVITTSAGAWVDTLVQTVMDASAGGATRTDNGAIQVTSAVLGITKTAAVVWDPINFLVDPKAIPGAVIEYTITVTNTGSIQATAVAITDTLPTELDLAPALPAAYLALPGKFQYTLDALDISSAVGFSTNTGTGAVVFPAQTVTEAGGASPSFVVTIAATLK